jgi:hypothetical protein
MPRAHETEPPEKHMDTNGMESLFTAWVLSMITVSVLAAPFIIVTGYTANARRLLSASGERGI